MGLEGSVDIRKSCQQKQPTSEEDCRSVILLPSPCYLSQIPRWTAKPGDVVADSELIRFLNESEWDVYIADIKTNNKSGTITIQISYSVEVLQVCIY